jgi:alkylated DNA repair dioxygenase AlkB
MRFRFATPFAPSVLKEDVQQMALFGSGDREFVDDESGKIAYYPAVFSAAESKRLFEHFAKNLDWAHETMWMYDHTVEVPRLIARFSGDGDMPGEVTAVWKRVEEFLKAPFNSVSFQYYRDAHDSVSWHSDHTEDLIENAIVAVVSLGAVREMRVRSKERPRRAFSCALDPGSVFFMGGRAQDFWEHHIPKVRDAVEPRISIAFRQKR